MKNTTNQMIDLFLRFGDNANFVVLSGRWPADKIKPAGEFFQTCVDLLKKDSAKKPAPAHAKAI